MGKITALLSSTTGTILLIGTSLVIISCMWKALTYVLNGDPKGAVKIIIEYVIVYALFILIPTIFAMIKAALS
jgi:hypothetical protein